MAITLVLFLLALGVSVAYGGYSMRVEHAFVRDLSYIAAFAFFVSAIFIAAYPPRNVSESPPTVAVVEPRTFPTIEITEAPLATPHAISTFTPGPKWTYVPYNEYISPRYLANL